VEVSPVGAAGGDDAAGGACVLVTVLRRAAADDDSPLSKCIRVRGRLSLRSGFCSRGSESAKEESIDFRLRPRLLLVLATLGAGGASA
jgi:hypothetical protein